MADYNRISFNGPADSGKSVCLAFDGGAVDGRGCADALKFSTGLRDFDARFGTVFSGSEDAVDVNNGCSGIRIAADRYVLGGRMGITIKGGSTDVTVEGWLEGHGRECDVDIGNWSDQSHEPVRGVKLGLRKWDGSPVRVRVINGEQPAVLPGSGPYRFVFPWPWLPGRRWLIRIFHQLRRIGLFR
jgi:hypothetical protein